MDIALFSAGGGASKVFAPEAVARGAVVVDNSSQWRMEPGVPLVVAGVNDADAAAHEGIVANPNCSTMQLMPVLAALRDSAGIERVVVDTYQAVSGTGNKAVVELEQQVRAHVAGEPLQHTVYPHQIAFNVLPHIDVFREDGYTKEEWKVIVESRKILHLPELRVSCTAVRVPVVTSHSEAVHVELQRPMTRARGARALRRRAGRHRPRRSGRATSTRWPPRPPAATRSSSAASARTPPSRTAAGWPSGSSRTTCARALPRTRWRSPRSSPATTGWRRRPAVPSGPRDERGAQGSSRRHRQRGPRLQALPAVGATHPGRAG